MAFLYVPVTVVCSSPAFDDALANELRQVNEKLQPVTDFFRNSVEVEVTWDVQSARVNLNTDMDFSNNSRTFPSVYLLPVKTVYDNWLGYTFERRFAEIAAADALWPFTVEHELGHLFGLQHNRYTFMHPQMAQVKRLQLISRVEREMFRENVAQFISQPPGDAPEIPDS